MAGPDGLRARPPSAVATAGDAVARAQGLGAVADAGLHGGRVDPRRGGSRLTLRSDELVPGAAVSGTVDVGAAAVVAHLAVGGRGVPPTTVEVTWPTTGGAAVARATGTSGGVAVAGSGPAP